MTELSFRGIVELVTSRILCLLQNLAHLLCVVGDSLKSGFPKQNDHISLVFVELFSKNALPVPHSVCCLGYCLVYTAMVYCIGYSVSLVFVMSDILFRTNTWFENFLSYAYVLRGCLCLLPLSAEPSTFMSSASLLSYIHMLERTLWKAN
jgi:hypothetical protein